MVKAKFLGLTHQNKDFDHQSCPHRAVAIQTFSPQLKPAQTSLKHPFPCE
jgi:hypothetical protein